MNTNDKGIQPVKISGKVVKDNTDDEAYKVTHDKIEKFLNEKKKSTKIPTLVNDDVILENLKSSGVYDIEKGDLTKIPTKLKKWASYVPQNIVGTIEPGRSKPKLFKKLNDENTHILQGISRRRMETADCNDNNSDLSGLFDAYPNIFSMDNPVANSRMYIINGKIVSAWALYYGPNSIRSPEDYAKNVDMVYNVPYVFSAFELKAQLGLGAEMKITAGDETEGEEDSMDLNDNEQWQMQEIENGKFDGDTEEETKEQPEEDNTEEQLPEDKNKKMLGQDIPPPGNKDNAESAQSTNKDNSNPFESKQEGSDDPSNDLMNQQMDKTMMPEQVTEMDKKVKWTKWYLEKKVNLSINFRKKISFHKSVYGNSYVHIHRDEKGIADKLTILQPERMKIYLDPLTTKILFYVYLPPILGGTMLAAYPSANRLQDISMLNAPVLRFPSPIIIPVKDMLHFKTHDYTEYPFGFSELKSATDICQARFDINLLAPYYFKKYCKTMLHVKYDNEQAQGGKLEKKISDMKNELEDLEPGSDLITGPFWQVNAIGPSSGQSEIFALTNDLDEQLFAVTGVPITYFKPKGSTDRLVTNEDKVFLGKLKQDQLDFVNKMSRKVIIPAINDKFGMPEGDEENNVENDEMPLDISGFDNYKQKSINDGIDKEGIATQGQFKQGDGINADQSKGRLNSPDVDKENDELRDNVSNRTQDRMYGETKNPFKDKENKKKKGKKKIETADFVTGYDVNNDPTFSTDDEYVSDTEYEHESSYPKIEFGDITKTDLTQEIANTMVLLDKGIIDINRAAERVGERPPGQDLQLKQQQQQMNPMMQGMNSGVVEDGEENDSTMDGFVRMRGGLDMDKQNKNGETDKTMNPEGKQKHRDTSPKKGNVETQDNFIQINGRTIPIR